MMQDWVVTLKATGAEVYRYQAEAAIEWGGFEFSTHDHTPEPIAPPPPPPPPEPRKVSKLEFIDRLGDPAFKAILSMAKVDLDAEAFVKRFDITSVEPSGISIDLTDPRTVAGVTQLGQALQAMGVVQAGWAEGVLNG